MNIIDNISSYQANEWAAATGLAPETAIPALVGIVIAGIGLQLLPGLLSS